MSGLGFIEKLLDGVEVVWTALGNVAEIGTGSHDTKDAIEDGQYTFYARGREPLRLNEFDFEETAIITAGDGVGVGKVFHYAQGKYALHQRAYRIAPYEVLNPRYLYHFIVANFYSYVQKTSVHASVTSLRRPMFLKFQIPIPCPENPEKSLAIQAEIVRILDAFTAMTTELTTELSLRKKQYNYYRDLLLTEKYDNSIESTIGEVLDMRAGKHIKAKDISANKSIEHNYECYGGNGSRGFVSNYSHDGDYTLIGRQGALCGNVKRAKGKFYATEHAVVCSPKLGINIDWAFYMLTFMDLNQYKSKSAQPGLAVGNIAKLPITVPPLNEQERIVAILDKFDTLTTSITEGLPREIELRKKQYDYYRDLLLSFPKPEEKDAA